MSDEEKLEDQSTGDNYQPTENKNVSEGDTQHTTLNTQHNDEVMEVHKHPHHVTHPKKWGEYLLEFFMLFFAVFLGFLTENYRESLVNKEKEKHYMENLVGDLRADTAALNRAMKYNGVLMRMLDSAIQIAPERLTDINVQDTFFHYTFLYYSFVPTFTASTNTISQLKAGGFNILRSDKTKDSINSLYNYYDNNVNFDTKYAELNFLDVAHKMQSLMRLPKSGIIVDGFFRLHYPC